jgi:ketosteroid isomerase-like protein
MGCPTLSAEITIEFGMPDIRDIALEYIRAIEAGATGEQLARFFTPDVKIVELPSRMSPNGSVSDLARTLERAERGQQLFQRQTYTVTNIVVEGDRVALELDWIGITAVPIAHLPAGSEMRDQAAIFLRFRDGRIAHQSHYDCFAP